MAKLPCADDAEVSIDKLRDFCLSPTHEEGQYKARVFASRLGLNAQDRLALRGWLLRAVQGEEATLFCGDQYGWRYTVDFTLTWQGRRAVVRSLWIHERGAVTSRLLSCFVL